MLLTQEIEVILNSSNIDYYENLGYEIPRYVDLKNRLKVKRGTKLLVKVKDLHKNSSVKIKYLCDYCKIEIVETKYVDYNRDKYRKFVNKDSCNKCKYEKMKEISLIKNGTKHVNQKHIDIKNIKEEFLQRGYELLSQEYIDSNSYLHYKCLKHPEKIMRISYHNFYSGRGCKLCAKEITQEKTRKYTIEDVKKLFLEKNYIVLDNVYNGFDKYINYICKNHSEKIQKITLGNFMNGQGCRLCSIEKRKGENNPRWNPNLTDEERKLKRNHEGYIKWRLLVFKRDNYKCKFCGIKNKYLNAHHLDGFNWCKEKRLDVNNGITLCKNCHHDFHNNYGWRNNTKEQFEEWLKKDR